MSTYFGLAAFVCVCVCVLRASRCWDFVKARQRVVYLRVYCGVFLVRFLVSEGQEFEQLIQNCRQSNIRGTILPRQKIQTLHTTSIYAQWYAHA